MNKLFLSSLLSVAIAALTTGTSAIGQELATVPREKTIIFENIEGRVANPSNMNPYLLGNYLDGGMWQATQESLFYYNLETGKLMPWLAESGEYSEGATVITIRLRSGAKWSDNVPFTADDVVFTINMLKQNSGLQYSADMNEWVADVVASDPNTVVIKLNKPNPRFLLNYFGVRIWDTILIAPKHVWEGEDPNTFTNFDLAKGWPLGTGPYKTVRSTSLESVFDRRSEWWAADTGFHKMPVPERLIWIGIGTEDVRAAKIANDELDATWLMSKSTFEVAHQRNPNVIAWTKELPYAYLDACPRDLGINNALPPFDKAAVRQAIDSAINRDQVVAIAYEGMTEPSVSIFPTYPPLKSFLDRNAKLFVDVPIGKYDLARTDKLMTSEGFKKNADGIWMDADGKTVSFPMISRSGETDQLKMAPVIVSQLRKAGFDASFRALEDVTYYADVNKGDYTAQFTGICGSVDDPYASFSQFHSRYYAPIGESVPNGPAVSRYRNTEFDALVDKMGGLSSDDPAFDALADKALEIWTKDLPMIPLVQARLLTAFSTKYWTNWPTAENNYVHPGHWWVTGNLNYLDVQSTSAAQ